MNGDSDELSRDLGLGDVLLFGVGGIVGAGIYAIIGEASGLAGNLLWLSFAIAAVVSLLTGLAYAEFVSRFPDAGGSYEYVKQSFGPKAAMVLSVLMLFTGVAAAGAIGISFSDYLTRLWDIPDWTATLGAIAAMGVVGGVGIRESSWFNNLATVVTLVGLGAVVWVSLGDWGTTDLLSAPPEGWSGILQGSALIFFSFVGFEDLVKMAEETKNARRTMPRGVMGAGLIVLVLYLLIAVSAVSVLDWRELASSGGPLAAVMSARASQAWVTALIAVALFATSKTILSNVIGTSRLIFDVARDEDIPILNRLGDVDGETGTPVLATALITGVAMAFGAIGDLRVVASISNVFVFLMFLSVNLGLLRFRWTHRHDEAPFHIPMNVAGIPAPTVLATIGLLVLLGFNVKNLLPS